jgi:flagellar protein FliJ
MTNFRFRLETLLKLRRAALDQQRAKLAEIYRAEAALKEQQEALDRQTAEAQAARRAAGGEGSLDVDAVLQSQRFQWSLQAQRTVLAEHERRLAEARDAQRQSVIAADRDVKVLEKLRERRLAEHRRDECLQDVKLMDEAAARVRREES